MKPAVPTTSTFAKAVEKIKDLFNYGGVPPKPKTKKEPGEGLGRTADLLKKVDD